MDRSIIKKEDIILHTDVYAGLDFIEDNSITVAITSPPYWKQRDYKFKGQIGQEKTPEEYIGRLVTIYKKLYQKLKEDGVFFLNIGDKYKTRYGKSHLLQIPYRIAYHMTKTGWHLEDIIIWYKPNHMPSSVKDRFTNTYEPILVLAKSKNNIYLKDFPKVIEIPLQQTMWKHTAVFPEVLVYEMLKRVKLKDGDIILDPFAGTGTTAKVVKDIRESLYSIKIFSIMIEKSAEFIEIIKQRCGIKNIFSIKEITYTWNPIKEENLPQYVTPRILNNDKSGEIYIVHSYEEFLSVLKGITLNEFKNFHREDALFFLGIKNWNLNSLYYIHLIYNYGYVLRNMIVISNKKSWYPVFMFARDSTKVSYKFYLDRVRKTPETIDKIEYSKYNFIGMKVLNIVSKNSEKGFITNILERYNDFFPKIVVVEWQDKKTVEFVLHPDEDEIIMEGLKFLCPVCKTELIEPFDLMNKNFCPNCGLELWKDINSLPLIEEPYKIKELSINNSKENNFLLYNKNVKFIQKDEKTKTTSKFKTLERINWGASPGARKLMQGEYFTKMRLYKIEQPFVAQYLTILRKQKGMTIQDIINRFPPEYQYTVGHWFRKDFGGSVPLPDDIVKLEKILNIKDKFLDLLKKTALKFQTVKTFIKGKNPGDFIKENEVISIKNYFKFLYMPPDLYIKEKKINPATGGKYGRKKEIEKKTFT